MTESLPLYRTIIDPFHAMKPCLSNTPVLSNIVVGLRIFRSYKMIEYKSIYVHITIPNPTLCLG